MKLSRRQVLKTSSLAVAVALGSLWGLPFGDRAAGPAGVTLRFAVIGDYGWVPGNPGSVASLVRTWSPDFVVTTGDNNYRCGEASTIDANIGQFYHDFIFPYRGTYGAGATVNRFFPTLGNHDWGGGHGIAPGLTECRGVPSQGRIDPYLAYFQLPGNNRYYDVQQGPVHLFFLDSDGREPDSNTSDSVQAQWLQARLAASTAPWKLVFFHHPPYSAGYQGTFSLQGPWMRWPFKAWGASAVLSGHAHSYERIVLGGFPYFVNGLGGAGITSLGPPVIGAQSQYTAQYGAQLVTATANSIEFDFIEITGARIDSHSLPSFNSSPLPPESLNSTPASVAAAGTETVTWAEIIEPSPSDWIGLYVPGTANPAYLAWMYVSCSHTQGVAKAFGSCPFPVPGGLATGSYEFRLFTSNTYTRLATSASFTVTGPPSLSVTPSSVAAGATETVTWSGIVAPTPSDWIGLYVPGTADTTYLAWMRVSCSQTPGAAKAAGSCPFPVPGGLAAGSYEFRLFSYDTWTRVATSGSFTVTGSPSLSATPSSVAAGATETMTWSGIVAPTPSDWIGLYVPGTADTTYLAWMRVSCSQTPGAAKAAGSCPFPVPGGLAAGSYEFRLFSNGTWTRVAASNWFSVTP